MCCVFLFQPWNGIASIHDLVFSEHMVSPIRARLGLPARAQMVVTLTVVVTLTQWRVLIILYYFPYFCIPCPEGF